MTSLEHLFDVRSGIFSSDLFLCAGIAPCNRDIQFLRGINLTEKQYLMPALVLIVIKILRLKQNKTTTTKKPQHLKYCLSFHAVSSLNSLLFFSVFSLMTPCIRFSCRLRYQSVSPYRCFNVHSS